MHRNHSTPQSAPHGFLNTRNGIFYLAESLIQVSDIRIDLCDIFFQYQNALRVDLMNAVSIFQNKYIFHIVRFGF